MNPNVDVDVTKVNFALHVLQLCFGVGVRKISRSEKNDVIHFVKRALYYKQDFVEQIPFSEHI